MMQGRMYSFDEVTKMLLSQHINECEVCRMDAKCNMYEDIEKQREQEKITNA